jgi:hypothetical protein
MIQSGLAVGPVRLVRGPRDQAGRRHAAPMMKGGGSQRGLQRAAASS